MLVTFALGTATGDLTATTLNLGYFTSIADWMGMQRFRGGLGLGTGPVSLVLTIIIVAIVGYLTVTRRDVQNGSHGLFVNSLIGGLFAGLFAYIAVTILMHWFKRKEIMP